MQRTLLLSGIITLVSCTSDFQPLEQPGTADTAPRSEVRQNLGEQVVQELRARYADTRANCGVPARPSYACNGLIIRGTTYSPDYHAWNNSPDSHRKGAVSFAYLRRDAVFTTFNVSRTNGYIFKAYDFAGHQIKPEVLCAFPVDGFTSLREGTGCGADPNYPTSGPCQEQKIFTAQEWLTHVEGPDGYRAMCGFDVRLSLNQGAWRGFDENNKARNLLPLDFRYGSNELRLQVWPDQDGSGLPLQAFFYFATGSDPALGREHAMLNQQDLKNTGKVTVPVIALRMPTDPEGDVIFEYHPGDQAVPIPEFRTPQRAQALLSGQRVSLEHEVKQAPVD